jgi:hypothetical protein
VAGWYGHKVNESIPAVSLPFEVSVYRLDCVLVHTHRVVAEVDAVVVSQHEDKVLLVGDLEDKKRGK